MVNETLCKLLCFNLTYLVHEQEKLGIAPVFWKDDRAPVVCKLDPLPIRNAVEVAGPGTRREGTGHRDSYRDVRCRLGSVE